MARMVVLDFTWYWAMIGEIEKFVYTLPIHSPQTKFPTSVHTLWKGHGCTWAILNDFLRIRWFSTNCHIISSCFSAEEFDLILIIISLWWSGFDRHWAILREHENSFADLIGLSWSWCLTGRIRLDFSPHFGNHKWEKMCPVYTWHGLV